MLHDNSKIEFETATEKDLETIAKMANEIWHDHYTSIIGKNQIDYMLEKFYSKEALQKQISEKQVFRFILDNGNRIGFMAITNLPDNTCFINKFYIYSGLQSKNIGSKILNILEEELKASNPGPVKLRLTVNRQNFKAINFYFKNGFKIESVADFDIGNGYLMNDFIMTRTI